MYQVEDLERAREELRRVLDKEERYDGNNPNKYRGEINTARSRVEEIEQNLKATGKIAPTEQELLDGKLNATFPAAKNREVVEYEGKNYRRRFTPGARSRSGSVTRWDKYWELAD